MTAQIHTPDYWQQRYQTGQTNWDMKSVSPPLKAYIDQLTDKHQKILIPGAGSAHEAAYLHRLGFDRVYVLDFAALPLENFHQNNPSFPKNRLLQEDFFTLNEDGFDLILEQTFLCALHPDRRPDYAQKMHELLADGGRLVGLLFDHQFAISPPFSGNLSDYQRLFSPLFHLDTMAPCHNSIAPRLGKELFIKATKKSLGGFG